MSGVTIPDRWERLDGLHCVGQTSWVALAVDEVGNLIAFSELVLRGLPSQVAPQIVQARKAAGFGDRPMPWAGPAAYLGQRAQKWGDPLGARDEFAYLHLPLEESNEDPVAGMLRVGELLRCDPEHRFADWHEKSGEPGAPRLFLRGVPMLVEQLSSAPLAGDGEPLARSAVQPEWEQQDGGLVAALRYAAMSRPSPSKPAEVWEPDPRKRALRAHLDMWNQGGPKPRYRFV